MRDYIWWWFACGMICAFIFGFQYDSYYRTIEYNNMYRFARRSVVVAKVNIIEGSIITEGMLEIKPIYKVKNRANIPEEKKYLFIGKKTYYRVNEGQALTPIIIKPQG